MNQQRSRITTSQHESRISSLEKRHADHGADVPENGAYGSIHLERPRDQLRVLEEAADLVVNDRRSTAVAKGRTLVSIVGMAAQLLPLVKMADLHEKDWETIKREQDEWFDLLSNSPKARRAINTLLEISVERSATTGEPLTITSQIEDIKAELYDKQA